MTEQALRISLENTARGYLGVTEGSEAHHGIVDLHNSHRPLARGYALKYSDDWGVPDLSRLWPSGRG